MRKFENLHGLINYWFEDSETITLFEVLSPHRQGTQLLISFENYILKQYKKVKYLQLQASDSYGIPLEKIISFYQKNGYEKMNHYEKCDALIKKISKNDGK